MLAETSPLNLSYLDVNSPWNFGVSYQINNFVGLSAQYLYGSQASITAHVTANPGRPPLIGGKDLAPVPMRIRANTLRPTNESNEVLIRKVLAADQFEIFELKLEDNLVNITVKNTKFRSTAQAVGRLASTLQRFTSDNVKYANITFFSRDLRTASYRVDLDKISSQQFDSETFNVEQPSIVATDPSSSKLEDKNKRLNGGAFSHSCSSL